MPHQPELERQIQSKLRAIASKDEVIAASRKQMGFLSGRKSSVAKGAKAFLSQAISDQTKLKAQLQRELSALVRQRTNTDEHTNLIIEQEVKTVEQSLLDEVKHAKEVSESAPKKIVRKATSFTKALNEGPGAVKESIKTATQNEIERIETKIAILRNNANELVNGASDILSGHTERVKLIAKDVKEFSLAQGKRVTDFIVSNPGLSQIQRETLVLDLQNSIKGFREKLEAGEQKLLDRAAQAQREAQGLIDEIPALIRELNRLKAKNSDETTEAVINDVIDITNGTTNDANDEIKTGNSVLDNVLGNLGGVISGISGSLDATFGSLVDAIGAGFRNANDIKVADIVEAERIKLRALIELKDDPEFLALQEVLK